MSHAQEQTPLSLSNLALNYAALKAHGERWINYLHGTINGNYGILDEEKGKHHFVFRYCDRRFKVQCFWQTEGVRGILRLLEVYENPEHNSANEYECGELVFDKFEHLTHKGEQTDTPTDDMFELLAARIQETQGTDYPLGDDLHPSNRPAD